MTMPVGEPRDILARLVTGQDLYRIGDGLKVGFKTSASCEYLLFHRSASGDYTLLAPRDGSHGKTTAGEPILLPSAQENFQVSEPVGVEQLVLLCARNAMDLSGVAPEAPPPAGLAVVRHQYQVTR